MKFNILTLFQKCWTKSKYFKRAKENGISQTNIINIEVIQKINTKHVDDTPYGGGRNGNQTRCGIQRI